MFEEDRTIAWMEYLRTLPPHIGDNKRLRKWLRRAFDYGYCYGGQAGVRYLQMDGTVWDEST